MRRYHLWCPEVTAPPAPSLSEQFDQWASIRWTPDRMPCRFERDQEFELYRWQPGPAVIAPMEGININEYARPWTEIVRLIEEHYRCRIHHCAPEVFRQHAPVQRRWNRLIEGKYEQVTLGFDVPGMTRLEYPDTVDERYRGYRRYAYIDAISATSTHRLW